ncbi:hypothetical protein O7632_02050 [Solwaraspora sp. WMMD406]|uniref:hypothetical protein n=1 Tax=Solwaraspora sp. WMMD406 TaxID=3016095 RepID=UPI0024161F79|nr:hypothetical protein [Solwaraspora sp. WMMD406]MDG4762902.1 hypothetical protein [Solwaraspora sp. WMMD406]
MTYPDEDLAPADHLAPDERDPEAPPADAYEQSVAANPVEQGAEVHRGLEVDDWDAVEQARVVDFDDDGYR